DHILEEFSDEKEFLIGKPRSDKGCNRGWIRLLGFIETADDKVKCFFPSCGNKCTVLLHKRSREPFGTIDVLVGKTSATAELAVVKALILIVDSRENLVILDPEGKLATGSAVGADGLDLLHGPPSCLELERLGQQRTYRADRDAGTAVFAIELAVERSADLCFDAPVYEGVSTKRDYFVTDPRTFPAVDAAVLVTLYQRIFVIDIPVKLFICELVGADLVFIGQVLKIAVSGSITNRAINGMFQQKKFQHELSGSHDLVRSSADDHPLCYRSSAGRNKAPFHLLHFDQTHPATAKRMQFLIVAENRDTYACSLCGVKDGSVLRYCHLLVVYREIYHRDRVSLGNRCSLFLLNCHEAAGIIAGLAFRAFFLDQFGNLPFFPLDRINRTGFQTGSAFDTLFRNDLPEEKLLAAVGRAALVVYVSLVLVAEILDR